uniref:Uncharacterized protein n=1 Tax=Fagus sylvatica TaxID=28930 RepID=A0A2N9I7C7_FAGSY
MKANSANLQALVEERMPRPPEVVQPAAQPRQGFWGINARPIPPIRGHFKPQVEEPWLGRRPAKQQRQEQQFSHNAALPRHANQFGEPRGANGVMMSIRMLGMIQEKLEVIMEVQGSGKGLITGTPIGKSKMDLHGNKEEQGIRGQ